MVNESDCIFRSNPSSDTTDDCVSENVFYTLLGKQDFIDDDKRPRANTETNDVLAKIIHNASGVPKYYIKTGAYGRVFNPLGMYSEGKQSKFVARIGRNEYEFKQVNQQIFNMYVQFLATKNLAWLNNAERELR